MEPGDVLLHDVMAAHGSPETHGKALRRPAEEILADEPWVFQWIDRRLRLAPLALHRFQQAYPQWEQFIWKISPEIKSPAAEDEVVELKVGHIWHMPGATCSAGNAGKSTF